MAASEQISFDEDGLVPCITQDARTGEVLTLAYMSSEALELTRERGELHFWSRSRGELWRKGETSGNVLRVVALRYDCDGDAVLALVEPAGPACHTGARTCFYRGLGDADPVAEQGTAADAGPVPHEAIPALERTLAARRGERPEGSYTVELLDDPELVGEKIREEADEVARAIAGEPEERVAEEAADVLYHLQVGLASREVSLAEALEVLNARRR